MIIFFIQLWNHESFSNFKIQPPALFWSITFANISAGPKSSRGKRLDYVSTMKLLLCLTFPIWSCIFVLYFHNEVTSLSCISNMKLHLCLAFPQWSCFFVPTFPRWSCLWLTFPQWRCNFVLRFHNEKLHLFLETTAMWMLEVTNFMT